MQNLKSVLYREYQGGILVYDSHSRTPGESDDFENLPKTQMTPEKLSLLDGCELNDRLQYMKMPQYPSTKYIRKEYTLVYPTENTLSFNSKFESGNLAQAIKISENEYNLFLEFDTETQGFTQWYYFSAKSYKPEHTVKFNILNLIKPHSLYTHGLKPLIFSTKTTQCWERGGFDISYTQNSIPNKQQNQSSPSTYFTLSFSYKFEKEADRVFFAHNYPYTYSRLQTYIQDLNKTVSFRPYLKVTSLCKTLAGNACPQLTITEDIENYIIENSLEKVQKKQIIFITSRVHPGESNSSFIVKGLIDYLLTNTGEAKVLRSKFIFIIIPMLNPDGVIYGNSRCSLLGVDLNRRWKNPNKILHPTIYYTKALLESLKKQAKIFMFCDIHGHSRKKGSFIYACKKSGRNIAEQKENIWIRMFPLVMAHKYSNFDWNLCTFRIEKFKESTARVVVFKEFGVLNSYTLENSFLGLGSEYDQVKLQDIGYSLCNVIWFFRNKHRIEKGVGLIYNKIIGQLIENSGVSVMDSIESVMPDVIGEVYDERDYGDSDESKEIDVKVLDFKKTENKITVKRRSTKVRSRIQLRSNYSSTLIPRIGSVSGEKTGNIPPLMRDKKGSFRRLKIMLK